MFLDPTQQEGISGTVDGVVAKTCLKCGGAGPFYADKTYKDGFKPQCKKCEAEKRRGWRAANPEKDKVTRSKRKVADLDADILRFQEIKAQVFAKYGGHCNSRVCSTPGGCTDVRCLQVDHVNDDGHKDRLSGHRGYKNRTRFWKFVLNDREGRFQLLCANCNTVKAWETNRLRLVAENRRKRDLQ